MQRGWWDNDAHGRVARFLWSPPSKFNYNKHMFSSIRAIYRADPSAKHIEVLLYPGLWAIWMHRAAHALYCAHIPFFPRLISQVARLLTLVEIHPGARIGQGLFIDHGAGTVIGETAVIGNWCVLYHEVTLGGTGYTGGKRHPTLKDHVVVGPGAKILGNVSIGDYSRVAANALVICDVPAQSTVVGNPGRVVAQAGLQLEDELEHAKLPDPVLANLNQLNRRLDELEKRLG